MDERAIARPFSGRHASRNCGTPWWRRIRRHWRQQCPDRPSTKAADRRAQSRNASGDCSCRVRSIQNTHIWISKRLMKLWNQCTIIDDKTQLDTHSIENLTTGYNVLKPTHVQEQNRYQVERKLCITFHYTVNKQMVWSHLAESS